MDRQLNDITELQNQVLPGRFLAEVLCVVCDKYSMMNVETSAVILIFLLLPENRKRSTGKPRPIWRCVTCWTTSSTNCHRSYIKNYPEETKPKKYLHIYQKRSYTFSAGNYFKFHQINICAQRQSCCLLNIPCICSEIRANSHATRHIEFASTAHQLLPHMIPGSERARQMRPADWHQSDRPEFPLVRCADRADTPLTSNSTHPTSPETYTPRGYYHVQQLHKVKVSYIHFFIHTICALRKYESSCFHMWKCLAQAQILTTVFPNFPSITVTC